MIVNQFLFAGRSKRIAMVEVIGGYGIINRHATKSLASKPHRSNASPTISVYRGMCGVARIGFSLKYRSDSRTGS